MKRTASLDLELRVAFTLECDYELDLPSFPPITNLAPELCDPGYGGGLLSLSFRLRDLCLEDDRRDLLAGCSPQARDLFTAALSRLLDEYEARHGVFSDALAALPLDDGRPS